ncbi:hypothetical protein FPQ18DRAFT_303838 [Pyronema domesticum]|nr:hypothetical protein FPQ18DRAFT_303838 [Pyronema domesticum]
MAFDTKKVGPPAAMTMQAPLQRYLSVNDGKVKYWQKGADNILFLVCVFGLSRMFTSVFESTGHDLKADLGRLLRTSSDLGDLNITSLLIDNGADVSATDKDGITPLHLALLEGHEGVARLLIDRGGDDREQEESESKPESEAEAEESDGQIRG